MADFRRDHRDGHFVMSTARYDDVCVTFARLDELKVHQARGGVMDHHQQCRARGTPLEPVVRTAVDLDDFALIFDIHEDVSRLIGDAIFQSAADRDGDCGRIQRENITSFQSRKSAGKTPRF